MRDFLFKLPDTEGLNLQTRIREMLVTAILDGKLPPGTPLPSGRKLSKQLRVARNTVVLAYQQLVDDGYLEARERSGYYVNGEILKGRVRAVEPRSPESSSVDWHNRFQHHFTGQRGFSKPDNWYEFPYPFVYGQVDASLFPIADWRECSKQAVSVRAINDWSRDWTDRDDPELVEQLQTRVLPRRGVFAAPDEILVTLGAQQALYLLAELLVDRHTVVGMEDPGYFDARKILGKDSARIVPFPVDTNGLVISDSLGSCDYIFVTPSHQSPTTVTMPLYRREALLAAAGSNDVILIEDDYESEISYMGEPTPALKSLDHDGRVVYVGSLSKTLAPGLRVGFLVGPSSLITELREIRRLMMRHPPANNQHTVAQFLKRGFHDSLIRRLSLAYRQRWETMQACLKTYLPDSAHAVVPTFGGTSFWIRGPQAMDCRKLQQQAARQGILIEPGDIFFADDPPPMNYIRLGFSSIRDEQIEPGIIRLAELMANI